MERKQSVTIEGKDVNILGYTSSWDNLNSLIRGQLEFKTESEAIEYFEDIRKKRNFPEIWSYPYIKEYDSIIRIVVRVGDWCEIDRID